jgi:hypothetical protein
MVTEVKEIKLQVDMRFNMENPPNTRGKTHGRQPASNFTMIGVWLTRSRMNQSLMENPNGFK